MDDGISSGGNRRIQNESWSTKQKTHERDKRQKIFFFLLPWGRQPGTEAAHWWRRSLALWTAAVIGCCRGGGPGCSGGRGASRNVGAGSAAGVDPIGWRPYEGYPSGLRAERHSEWPQRGGERAGKRGRESRNLTFFYIEKYAYIYVCHSVESGNIWLTRVMVSLLNRFRKDDNVQEGR